MNLTQHSPARIASPSTGWWRPRWWELAPEFVLGAGLLIFFVQQDAAATSAFKSGRALTLMAIAASAWLLVRVVLARFVRWPLVRAGVLSVGALGILAIVVLPAYHDTTVIETFPRVEASQPPQPTPTVSEPAATNAPAVVPPAAPAPVRVRAGMFRGVDHRASGTVAIYHQPDGHFVVGLEDFDIQPGPHYVLYVVPGDNRTNRSGGVRLDDLRGNRGTQFYDVPATVGLNDGAWSVLVWCETFAVPVATATPV